MRDIVARFVEEYKSRYEYYHKLSEVCASMCKEHLHNNGIRCIVTSRAKSAESLYNKILYRSQEKEYNTLEDIRKDIMDLAGVRIALYFPGDISEVEKILRSQFIIADEPSRFDGSYLKYDRRFAGYRATHFHLQLKEAAEQDIRYTGEIVEIQVASVLMHAWAEVEHDLAYKAPQGGISDMEYALLAQLNGLVHSGEVTLEQLQLALNNRIEKEERPFLNHYELSSFILKNIPKILRERSSQPTLGRVDILFGLLKRMKLDMPSDLKKYLHMIEVGSENRPVGFQLIEKILADNVDKYSAYRDLAKVAGGEADIFYNTKFEEDYKKNKSLIDEFLLKWVEMESIIRKLFARDSKGLNKLQFLMQRSVDDNVVLPLQIQDLYQMRNGIIHGISVPEESDLIKAISSIEAVLERLLDSDRTKEEDQKDK